MTSERGGEWLTSHNSQNTINIDTPTHGFTISSEEIIWLLFILFVFTHTAMMYTRIFTEMTMILLYGIVLTNFSSDIIEITVSDWYIVLVIYYRFSGFAIGCHDRKIKSNDTVSSYNNPDNVKNKKKNV